MKSPFFALAALFAVSAFAVPVSVKDPGGKPLATVMVSRLPVKPGCRGQIRQRLLQPAASRSRPSSSWRASPMLPAPPTFRRPSTPGKIRLRKPGYKDLTVAASAVDKPLVMTPETDVAALAAQQPANAWSSTIDFGDAGPEEGVHAPVQLLPPAGRSAAAPGPDRRGVERGDQAHGPLWRAPVQRRPGEDPGVAGGALEEDRANPSLVPQGTPWSPDAGGHDDPRDAHRRRDVADARPAAATATA